MKLLNTPVLSVLLLALETSALSLRPDDAKKDSIVQRHDNSFTPDVILRVTYETISIGCTRRESAVINGTLPGPEVRIPPGKTTWIRVYNDIPDKNTTMHWHGLSQRTAAFSDGSPSVSQWPIPPHHFFDYEVHPELNDSGTYFYHSHVGFQMSTASGALIVEDVGKPPYEYDEERVILLGDYFARSDTSIEHGLTAQPFEWSGEASAVLINGIGVPTGETRGGVACQQPLIHVDPGKTYRLRFIGATSLSMVDFHIADHDDLTIIAADGQYTKPHRVRYMQISAGQRYDVLLKTMRESVIDQYGEGDFEIGYSTIGQEEGMFEFDRLCIPIAIQIKRRIHVVTNCILTGNQTFTALAICDTQLVNTEICKRITHTLPIPSSRPGNGSNTPSNLSTQTTSPPLTK